jgi:L-ascorbate metabolism protein UlaG (beta-lactamase superfamily)
VTEPLEGRTASPDAVRLTHVGGPTVLIEAAGWRILTDPTFDPPGRRYGFGWGTASRKLGGPAMTVDQIGDIDLVLLSHDHHADNLDDLGRGLLGRARTVLTTQAGARRIGLANVRGLAWWETRVVDAPGRPSLSVTATPCRHGPPLSGPVTGAVAGFDFRWEGKAGRWTVGTRSSSSSDSGRGSPFRCTSRGGRTSRSRRRRCGRCSVRHRRT